jgi:hypothetical protein
LRKIVDEQYDLCLYKCTEKFTSAISNCKNDCFRKTIVPYRFNNHASRDEEENIYRKCLSQKFPNITADDYMDCSQQLYKDRLTILSNFMGTVSEKVLSDLH